MRFWELMLMDGVKKQPNPRKCFLKKLSFMYLLLDKKVKYVTLTKGETVQKLKVEKSRMVQTISAGDAVLIEF